MNIEIIYAVLLQLSLYLDPNLVAVYLSPVFIFIATGLANKLKAYLSTSKLGFSGLTMMLIVGLLSIFAGVLLNLTTAPNLNIWVLILANCSGVFLNEFLKQLKQSLTKTQTPAETKLLG